jgi:hypothetical protein
MIKMSFAMNRVGLPVRGGGELVDELKKEIEAVGRLVEQLERDWLALSPDMQERMLREAGELVEQISDPTLSRRLAERRDWKKRYEKLLFRFLFPVVEEFDRKSEWPNFAHQLLEAGVEIEALSLEHQELICRLEKEGGSQRGAVVRSLELIQEDLEAAFSLFRGEVSEAKLVDGLTPQEIVDQIEAKFFLGVK